MTILTQHEDFNTRMRCTRKLHLRRVQSTRSAVIPPRLAGPAITPGRIFPVMSRNYGRIRAGTKSQSPYMFMRLLAGSKDISWNYDLINRQAPTIFGGQFRLLLNITCAASQQPGDELQANPFLIAGSLLRVPFLSERPGDNPGLPIVTSACGLEEINR